MDILRPKHFGPMNDDVIQFDRPFSEVAVAWQECLISLLCIVPPVVHLLR